MNEVLQGQLQALPERAGVYIMKDRTGRVIYVGKAARLKDRVRSYFGAPTGLTPKTRKLVEQVADLEYIVTDHAAEALILENNLIKRHQPRYNVRLKDDKTYPYLRIDVNEPWPQVLITRRVQPDGARYFGPYANSGSVRQTLALVKKLFPYRSCSKPITGKDPRPCLDFHIHRCVGPCIGAVSRAEYMAVIGQVILFLEGKQEQVVRDLRNQMAAAAEDLQFERAAALRDQVRAVERVIERQKVVSPEGEDEDVVGFARQGGECCVQVFTIRGGHLFGREHFILEGTQDEEPAAIMTCFIQQYYASAPNIPDTVLLQHPVQEAELIAEWMRQRRRLPEGTSEPAVAMPRHSNRAPGRRRPLARKVTLQVPHRGEKKRLMEMVVENARQTLQQLHAKWLADTGKTAAALTELQDMLDLPQLPRRIECYDISNISGTSAVGSMVVFQDGKPRGSDYRRFRIKTVAGVDDYAMMQEMLRRRFRRAGASADRVGASAMRPGGEERDSPSGHRVGAYSIRSGEEGGFALALGDAVLSLSKDEGGDGDDTLRGPDVPTAWALPDLAIIDGGRGHLTAATEVMRSLGVHTIPICALAKQQEEVFLPHVAESVMLPRTSQGLYLLQRVRDEAHRFAITYHRVVRSKAATASVLEELPGVGPRRRKALLQRFGSLRALKDAPVEEIASVRGMTKSLAEKVKALG